MKYIFSLFLCLTGSFLFAQMPHQKDAGELYQQVQKLNVLGNVLYLAAHPDDENTRFISYCANHKLYNTAYLSLTRGDGGQNLIGPEISEELGIIRTQELLAARRIDGGQQYFSRAIDFGYSKTSAETQEIWDREKVLGDVVWVIRKFRPDIIVLRFPPDPRGGHGHHTASAELGIEAFKLAADSSAYPEQLEWTDIWQAKRIVTNTGRWWRSEISADEDGIIMEDLGPYNPLLGSSINEIAAKSRSQHKSQGFGTSGSRGELPEYFEHQLGEKAQTSLFDGVDDTWQRVPDSKHVQKAVDQVIGHFRADNPAASIPDFMLLKGALHKLEGNVWAQKKTEEVDALIKGAMALYLEAKAPEFTACPSDSIEVNFEFINRSDVKAQLLGIRSSALEPMRFDKIELGPNKLQTLNGSFKIPDDLPFSQPYWLVQKAAQGIYNVKHQQLIGLAENPAAIRFQVEIEIEGETFLYEIPLIHKWNDPVKGELYRPFIITPPVFVNFSEPIYLFSKAPQKLEILVKSGAENFEGQLELHAPEGWIISQSSWPIKMSDKMAEQIITIEVEAGPGAQNGILSASVSQAGKSYHHALNSIEYDHIPNQVWFPESQTKLTYIDLESRARKIGYITGAGDNVPRSLRSIGLEVVELEEGDISAEKLREFDAVLMGIRVLNTNERIEYIIPALLEYAKNGGTLVFQYNTAHALKTEHFAPYPLSLSRDRVTEENAEVQFLSPEHDVLNTPNKITQADFDAWVQERGLYFPDKWDDHYTPILSWHDSGEDPKNGALLLCKYGDGYFVYTGISFFRELPAGVPGAFRLLANILSLGN